jgi:hypothetical protein
MLALVMFMIMLASMGFGLLISAVSRTLEKAVAASTQLAVVQVTLSGALFHLKWGLGLVSVVLPARLGVAAIASYAQLNPSRQTARLYEDWMWSVGAGRFWLVMAGLGLVFASTLALAVWRLQQRWRKPA